MKLNLSTKLSLLAPVTPPATATPTAPSSAQDARQALSATLQTALKARDKRLADMQQALVRLRAMPSTTKVAAKRIASERAAMLKRQLDLMKQMMIGATPVQARGMASQLKAIARELAALAKNLPGGDGASAPTPTPAAADSAPAAETDGASAEATAPDASAADSGSAETAAAEAAAANEEEDEQQNSDDPTPTATGTSQPAIAAYAAQNAAAGHGARNGNGAEKDADSTLKKSLTEACNALRSCIALLKSRLGTPRKENKDLQEAAAQLKELEHALANTDDANAHPAESSGETGSADGGGELAVDAASGGGADVAVDVGDAAGAAGGSISVSA